ncbi:MAG TPA: hypothetical protein VMC03_11650 [Streptosporangiaceae bacterium]|nr:hypothetical protein [Streptosporangiaceae bacterium]
MSGSPKYTVIDLSAELMMIDRAQQQRRAAARREREARRAAEYRRLRQERARRALAAQRAVISARLSEVDEMVTDLSAVASGPLAGDARALSADLASLREQIAAATDLGSCQRTAEGLRARALGLRPRLREARRAAKFRSVSANRAQAALDGEQAVISARLFEVEEMVAELGAVASGPLTGDAQALSADLAGLRERITAETDLAACLRAAEGLRARAVALLAREEESAGRADRWTVLADLRDRLAGPGADAARLEPDRYARCIELLGQLEAAAAEESVRFDALHGTVEHEVASYVARGADGALAARAKLDEAADRLDAIRAAAESAMADAKAFRDDGLAETLGTNLAAAVAGLAAGQADPAQAGPALAGVLGLAELLPQAEARLDEHAAAHERRAAFAETLKGVLAEHGMSFLGASDTGDRFILQFERPGGAVYTAAVDDGQDDELQLSYAIDGEADIAVLPEPGQAECDQTEAFLEAIHADLGTGGYRAGELQWDGKPPRGTHATHARRVQQAASIQRRVGESR